MPNLYILLDFITIGGSSCDEIIKHKHILSVNTKNKH